MIAMCLQREARCLWETLWDPIMNGVQHVGRAQNRSMNSWVMPCDPRGRHCTQEPLRGDPAKSATSLLKAGAAARPSTCSSGLQEGAQSPVRAASCCCRSASRCCCPSMSAWMRWNWLSSFPILTALLSASELAAARALSFACTPPCQLPDSGCQAPGPRASCCKCLTIFRCAPCSPPSLQQVALPKVYMPWLLCRGDGWLVAPGPCDRALAGRSGRGSR